MRILEALCVSQGWDLAIKWAVDAKRNRLEFATAWGTPGRRIETLIQESMGLTLENGAELPGRVWKEGRAVWFADLASIPASPRTEAALRQEMISGWAVPVRVGNKVLAILEFYSHFKLREDSDSMAAIETAASFAGTNAGPLAGKRPGRGALPPAGDSAGLGGRRHLRRSPPRQDQLRQSRRR